MGHSKNKERIIREAAELLGPRELAGRLDVRIDVVSAWINGTAVVPDDILIRLSEVLVSWSGKQKFT